MALELREIEKFLKEEMQEAKFSATQRKISGPLIQRYYQMLVDGNIPSPILVADNLIIDGQHRYIAGMIFGRLPESVPWGKPTIIQPFRWEEIIVDEIDWERG